MWRWIWCVERALECITTNSDNINKIISYMIYKIIFATMQLQQNVVILEIESTFIILNIAGNIFIILCKYTYCHLLYVSSNLLVIMIYCRHYVIAVLSWSFTNFFLNNKLCCKNNTLILCYLETEETKLHKKKVPI